jgi:hypothetical protein
VHFEGAALAGERGAAEGGDAVEVGAEIDRGVGVGTQLLDLTVDAGTALLGGTR